jgi:hypothetical protein
MKYRLRIYYSTEQRAEIWDRWQRGGSMRSIGRVFDWQSSSVFSVISPTGALAAEGRDIQVLDLMGPGQGIGYNPFERCQTLLDRHRACAALI